MKITILPERILEIVRTKEDANDLLVHIDLVLASLFKSSLKPVDVISAFMPYNKKQWCLSLIHEHDLSLTDLKQMQDFFGSLKDILSKMPVVDLEFAFEPGEKFIADLSGWFNLRCKTPVIMDIKYNPKIMAGVIIGFKGNFKDYSVAKILKDKLTAGDIHWETA